MAYSDVVLKWKIPDILILNQIRLTEDMLEKINAKIAYANTLPDTVMVVLEDNTTAMAKDAWLIQAQQRKAEYESDLVELTNLLKT